MQPPIKAAGQEDPQMTTECSNCIYWQLQHYWLIRSNTSLKQANNLAKIRPGCYNLCQEENNSTLVERPETSAGFQDYKFQTSCQAGVATS